MTEQLNAFIELRHQLWNQLVASNAKFHDSVETPIKVAYLGANNASKIIDAVAYRTTPLDVGKTVDETLANDSIVARVNGKLWDLKRPLETDCELQLLRFQDDDDEAKAVFWHSTAHVLGEAMELHFGGLLCYGPPIANGFYYDMHMPNGRTVTAEDYSEVEILINRIVAEEQPFERLEMTKEQLLHMFSYNQFKCRIIDKKIETQTSTVYKCGSLIDLCPGPHVPHTGLLKAVQILKSSATYWEGDSSAESLQRVYGISFPDKTQLADWKDSQEKAAKRDHRLIARQQQLFFFDEVSPGSCFFLPKGTIIYNRLMAWFRELYQQYGYQEVITPNVFNTKLWETSGHLAHYAANMFQFKIENENFAMKPMNCPGHCVIFGVRPRSKHELPLRLAEFGILHRNELSGALHGLTRVRRFVQDDAHIFCAEDQISSEIKSCLDLFNHVYCKVLGFVDFKLFLSTRPEMFMGELSAWDAAEQKLKTCLENFGHPWKINPGDGAFYGPKIDIIFADALKREHQCATIQLDFQQPERFQLQYYDTDEAQTKRRPVIIHRAILGSIERFIGVFAESCGGKWPFWLSPQQICIITVKSDDANLVEYASKLQKMLQEQGLCVEANNDSGRSLNKKIRNAQLAQFNYILVVGQNEMNNQSVNIRSRDGKLLGERKIADALAWFIELRNKRIGAIEEDS